MPIPNGSKKYRSVVRAVTSHPWLCLPEKLDVMAEILELRAAGQKFSDDEIRTRLGVMYDDDFSEDDEEADPNAPQLIGDVMIINLKGMLFPKANLITRFSGGTSTEQFIGQVRAAMADQRVRSILIRMDSPGGVATGVEEASAALYELRGKGKPIYGAAEGQCCSACYYIGSACDKLYAAPSCAVGSIGVFRMLCEATKQTALTGRTFRVIRSGRLKGAGNEYEVPSAAALASLQQFSDDFYNQFIAAVARNRGVSESTVRSDYGEGSYFLADRAATAGLVDGVATFEQVLAMLSPLKPQASSLTPAQSPITLPSSTTHAAPPPLPPAKEFAVMDKKIIAALYAVGALADMNASPEVCQAVLTTFFAAHGETVPAETPATLQAISRLHTSKNTLATVVAPLQPVQPVAPAAPAAPQLNEAAIRQAERSRIDDLRARAKLLDVPEADLTAAIDGGMSVEKAVDGWTSAKVKTQAPVAKITPVTSSADVFCAAAADALMARIDLGSIDGVSKKKAGEAAVAPLNEHARALQYASLLDIAKMAVEQSGDRRGGAPEQIAARFLALGGQGSDSLLADGYSTPADFPSILSNLAGKMLLKAHELAETTFQEYAYRMPSVADFKPKTLHATGFFNLMDRLPDRDEAEEDKESEETNWLQVDTYAKRTSLTPRMIVNDDLDVFGRRVMALQLSHDLTLNMLALNLLTGNVTLPDGVALFHANHANLISSGGAAPSVTTAAAMRLKLRNQTDVSGRNRIRVGMEIALVPSEWETAAEQTFLAFSQLGYTADSSVNMFRGKVRPVVEPALSDASATVWYGFASPAKMPGIVYTYLRGYENGQRRSWYDPATEVRFVEVKGNFAAGVADYRPMVKNPGA